MCLRLRALLPVFLVLASCNLLFNVAVQAQGTPAAATSPNASTPAAAAPTPAATSATPAPPTACAAAFGIFGPINATAQAASGNASAAQPTVSVTNNAAPLPAVTETNNGATNAGIQRAKAPAPKTPVEGLTGIFDLANPKLSVPERDALPKPTKHAIPLNASDVSSALQGKIAGVTSLVAIGPTTILYTIDPSKVVSAPPPIHKLPLEGGKKKQKNETLAQAIEDELITALDGLPTEKITPDVLNLPNGFQDACAIITMIGHQVPGIVSLAALSDSRILVGYDEGVTPSPLMQFKTLVGKLAVSTSPPAPKVRSVTMRLYYDRDAVSVAAVVQSAFSQLKVQSVSMNPAFTYRDAIVIADPTGTDSVDALDQARRMVAQLDEPRAQVVVNAWSLQISRDEKDKGNELVPQARRLAGGYNDALEGAIMRGWQYVNKIGPSLTNKSLSFDPLFASYLCSTFTYMPATTLPRMTTSKTGLCPGDSRLRYALGYSALFGQEDPDLIQMMILVMATTKPRDTIKNTVDAMESRYDPEFDKLGLTEEDKQFSITSGDYRSCQDVDKEFYKHQRLYFQKEKDKASPRPFDENIKTQIAPRFVAFNCTRAKLNGLTSVDGSVYSSSFVGKFRAAVADYLFQNKMKAAYPNDFDPFLFPASAATLDAALTPIVEAFNQDLEALQQNLQQQLTEKVPQDKHLHYTSNGLISVKVVSGNQATAQTQSLSYFLKDPTLSLENFAKNLASGQSSSVPLLAGSLSSVIATMGAYATSQPQQVTAKVGSGLSLTVTPFTLSSAKGAELNVNLTYNENGAATISNDATQSSATDDLNSRVSEHEVNTLVRMDSLKFFEISTMQSVIARQRKPWKPFDPVFELPLLDNPGIVIARRKPEVIYNQSIIFMEASVMPTAADLGQGLIYQTDRIGSNACPYAKDPTIPKVAHSRQDFCFDEETEPNPLDAIKQYHKQMINYFEGQYIDADGQVKDPPVDYLKLPTIPAGGSD